MHERSTTLRKRFVPALGALLALGALAGCVEDTQEAGGPDVAEVVMVNGLIYTCDDTTLELGLTDPPCEEYELEDQDEAEELVEEVEAQAVAVDNRVTIAGNDYICVDTAEAEEVPGQQMAACGDYHLLQAEVQETEGL